MNNRLASLQRWHERLVAAPYCDRDLIHYVQSEIRALEVSSELPRFAEPVGRISRPAARIASVGSPFSYWA